MLNNFLPAEVIIWWNFSHRLFNYVLYCFSKLEVNHNLSEEHLHYLLNCPDLSAEWSRSFSHSLVRPFPWKLAELLLVSSLCSNERLILKGVWGTYQVGSHNFIFFLSANIVSVVLVNEPENTRAKKQSIMLWNNCKIHLQDLVDWQN